MIILGAGLSGLITAHYLMSKGLTVKVLESRDRIGGRIHTIVSENGTSVEMGATWLWQQHTHLFRLLEELGLSYYEQYMSGPIYYEPEANQPIQKVQLPPQATSYRITGGSMALIKKLAEGLTDCIHTEEGAQSIDFSEQAKVEVVTNKSLYYGQAVVSTLPPQLLADTVKIVPALATDVVHHARNTHTWMHDSIKTSLVYSRPFWKQKGLSGAFFSNVGPVVEFYDHSDESGKYYALCGFVNGSCAALETAERKKQVIDQLYKVFGEQAQAYEECIEVSWRDEKYTSSGTQDLVPHQLNGHHIYQQPLYNGKLWLSGTETSNVYPGYMEGAVYRAMEVSKRILHSDE